MTRPGVVLAVALVAVLAGCGGGGGGSAPVAASGSPATLSDDALATTGYEAAGETTRTLNTTVSVDLSGDVELDAQRDVEATTPIRTYRRDTDAGPAVVAVAAAPAVRPIESQSIRRNPLEAVEPARLLGHVQSTYSADSLAQTGNETVTMLGNRTGMRTYEGTATRDGTEQDVTVLVASVQDGDEFVTVVAVAPAEADERERVQRLLDGVDH